MDYQVILSDLFIADLKEMLKEKLIEHREYICKNGQDLPEVRNWKWNQDGAEKGKPLAEKARVAVPK